MKLQTLAAIAAAFRGIGGIDLSTGDIESRLPRFRCSLADLFPSLSGRPSATHRHRNRRRKEKRRAARLRTQRIALR